MADEIEPTEKVKRTPEEKAARKAQREKKLANMSPRQVEKRKEIRAKKKAAKEQKAAKGDTAAPAMPDSDEA